MKIAFLHKALLDKEHEEIRNSTDKLIIENKKEYCNLHGYEFIEDTTPNSTVHWNEDYWAHIPVILNLLENKPDIDLIFFNRVNGVITDLKKPLEDFIKDFDKDKKIISTFMNIYIKTWMNFEDNDKIILKNFENHLHKMFDSNVMFVYNSAEAKKWLKLIYEDMRFNTGMFNEENGRKGDRWTHDGSQITLQAFTLYYENYPEFRNIVKLFPVQGICSSIRPTDEKNLKALKDFTDRFEFKDARTHNENNFMQSLVCGMDVSLLTNIKSK